MKTLFCALVCLSSVLAFAQGMNDQPRLPFGFRNPSVLPPGPEKEAAERQLEEYHQASREWGLRMIAEKRAKEKPNPLAIEVKAATRADGSIDHTKLSPKMRERYDASVRASIVDSALRGPSKRLIAIVGERPKEELERIVEAVSEVAMQQTVRNYPFESVARTIRQLVGENIQLTDKQLRELLAVPGGTLWRLDE